MKNLFRMTVGNKACKQSKSMNEKYMPVLTALLLAAAAPLGMYCGDAASLVRTIIDLMLDIAKYSGAALIVWGAIKTILAYKDDNTNEITQGIRLAIVGAMLFAAKTVLNAFIKV